MDQCEGYVSCVFCVRTILLTDNAAWDIGTFETRRDIPALVAGARTHCVRAFVHSGQTMHIVFLDEFGHIGPFVSRSHDSYRTSPVFGLAGYIMRESKIRGFSSWFHKLKVDVFDKDIQLSGQHPATWEKKGHELFTRGHVYKTKRLGYSLINKIKNERGKIFYHGIQKYENPQQSNPIGLYCTILSHTIRNLERCFNKIGDCFLIILDEHNSRTKLLESALRDMHGQDPVRRLVQAPFQAESHLYPTLQAADWIASIVGAFWKHKAMPREFDDHLWAERYFESRIASTLADYSSVKLLKR